MQLPTGTSTIYSCSTYTLHISLHLRTELPEFFLLLPDLALLQCFILPLLPVLAGTKGFPSHSYSKKGEKSCGTQMPPPSRQRRWEAFTSLLNGCRQCNWQSPNAVGKTTCKHQKWSMSTSFHSWIHSGKMEKWKKYFLRLTDLDLETCGMSLPSPGSFSRVNRPKNRSWKGLCFNTSHLCSPAVKLFTAESRGKQPFKIEQTTLDLNS